MTELIRVLLEEQYALRAEQMTAMEDQQRSREEINRLLDII